MWNKLNKQSNLNNKYFKMINIKPKAQVAYFSMEITLENCIKNFAGGLGILAGDILRSASEKKFPMLAVSLLYKHGYFKQLISKK